MTMIREGKWEDGRQLHIWPDSAEYIGWVVQTAGPVNLDLEDRSVMFNNGRQRWLPTGFPMVLKALSNGMAYCYNDSEGVLRLPVQLLKPFRK